MAKIFWSSPPLISATNRPCRWVFCFFDNWWTYSNKALGIFRPTVYSRATIFYKFLGIKGKCLDTQFECDNGKCINADDLCNYVNDCGDNSDEQRYVTGFKCAMGRLGNVCVLPQRLVNDSVAQCNDANDRCVINGTTRCHRCLTVDMFLAPTQVWLINNCSFDISAHHLYAYKLVLCLHVFL